MHRNGEVYEYIAVYVDDLIIAAKDPEAIMEVLMKKYKLKLKGTRPISFFPGCDYFHDNDGILCYVPCKCINRMMTTYKQLFNEKPRLTVTSPLEKGDHPELDTSELLSEDDVQSINLSLVRCNGLSLWGGLISLLRS
jgi:hypothetical protein